MPKKATKTTKKQKKELVKSKKQEKNVEKNTNKTINKTTDKTKKRTKSRRGLICGLVCGAIIVAIIAVVTSFFGYHKKTEIYTIKNENRGSEITFEFAGEDLGYIFTKLRNGGEFFNPENKSRIRIVLYDINYSNLIKEADAFPGEDYRDYEKGEFAGYEGYKVVRLTSPATEVDMALVLDKYNPEQNRVDGVKIDIDQNPAQSNEETFNSEKFSKSTDFQHLLKTLKLKIGEKTAE